MDTTTANLAHKWDYGYFEAGSHMARRDGDRAARFDGDRYIAKAINVTNVTKVTGCL